MSENVIVSQCSPTLAGLKTGNLFTCPIESKETLLDSVRRLNRKFVPRGIRLIPVKYMKNNILVYLYRPDQLKKDLSCERARKLLQDRNYPMTNPQYCVAELIRRMKKEGEFPHEVGLFLGYPTEDVEGFINNKAKNAKCVGTWKVYGNEQAARKRFSQFKECTKNCCEDYRRHKCLDRLIAG